MVDENDDLVTLCEKLTEGKKKNKILNQNFWIYQKNQIENQ